PGPLLPRYRRGALRSHLAGQMSFMQHLTQHSRRAPMKDEYVVEPAAIASRYFTEEDGEEEAVRIYLDGLDGGPDAVLCSHSDGAMAEPHFHHGSQFQLMLRGKTEFADELLEAPAVHYTDHNTAYGPFTMRERHQMLVLHPRPAGQVFMKQPGARTNL